MNKVQSIFFVQQLFLKLSAGVAKPTEKRHLMRVPPSQAHSVHLGADRSPSFQVIT